VAYGQLVDDGVVYQDDVCRRAHRVHRGRTL